MHEYVPAGSVASSFPPVNETWNDSMGLKEINVSCTSAAKGLSNLVRKRSQKFWDTLHAGEKG